MAVKTIEELLKSVNTILGENTSDEALTLLDDISDTFAANNQTEWKQKYEDNDKAWRERYRDRFLTGNTDLDKDVDADDSDDEAPKSYKYEDLFKEG